MQVIDVPIASLSFDPSNARKHSPKNLDAIKGSLAKFGQQKPIVISNGVVVAGNGTLEAARALGWESIKATTTPLTGPDLTAYAIADNRTGELAEWDDDALSRTLEALKGDGFALADIGFTDEDLAQWCKPVEVVAPGCDEDEVPEHVEPKTKLGDLYQLGEHRLLCGDSTDILQVERLMDGAKADMCFTDPPYGISYDDSSWKSSTPQTKNAKVNNFGMIANDDKDFDPRFLLEFFAKAKHIFIWGAANFCQHLPKKGSWIVWDRKTEAQVDVPYGDFDLCWSRENHAWPMVRIMWGGFHSKEKGEDRHHPTQKPIALAQWFFERWGKPNDLVIDLYLGSGSTLIACEKTKRKCYGMELDPHYCDVIVARWEKFTGKTATLTSAG